MIQNDLNWKAHTYLDFHHYLWQDIPTNYGGIVVIFNDFVVVFDIFMKLF
jgi:hypothetical protein